VFAPRTIRELRIDPAALALAKPAARVERESSMALRIGGAASRPVPRPGDSFFTPRRQLSTVRADAFAEQNETVVQDDDTDAYTWGTLFHL
jgi:hypothetical protein